MIIENAVKHCSRFHVCMTDDSHPTDGVEAVYRLAVQRPMALTRLQEATQLVGGETAMLQSIRSSWTRQILKPEDIAGVMREILSTEDPIDRDKEHFWAIGLNTAHCIKYIDLISLGLIDKCLVHPREVFRRAVHESAAALIVVHNHPGDQTEPSAEDKQVVEKIKGSGEVLGIELLDAVIVTTGSYHSFAESVWK